jgi:hypothetical protein
MMMMLMRNLLLVLLLCPVVRNLLLVLGFAIFVVVAPVDALLFHFVQFASLSKSMFF